MQSVNIASLNLVSKASICWGFFWRGLLITLASMLAGGLLGAVFGVTLALSGVTREGGQVVANAGGAIFGLLSGVVCLYIYVKWLLSARIGGFRLLLVRADSSST